MDQNKGEKLNAVGAVESVVRLFVLSLSMALNQGAELCLPAENDRSCLLPSSNRGRWQDDRARHHLLVLIRPEAIQSRRQDVALTRTCP